MINKYVISRVRVNCVSLIKFIAIQSVSVRYHPWRLPFSQSRVRYVPIKCDIKNQSDNHRFLNQTPFPSPATPIRAEVLSVRIFFTTQYTILSPLWKKHGLLRPTLVHGYILSMAIKEKKDEAKNLVWPHHLQ